MNTQEDKQLIEVEVRSVFGKDMVYPINDNAYTLARIAGTKTLSSNVLKNAIKLGLNVKEVTPNKLNLD